MGYLVRDACFPDLRTAKAAHCASVNGLWGATTSQYTTECTATAFAAANTTYPVCRRLNGGACTTYNQTYPSFVPCTYDGNMANQTDFFTLMLGFLLVVWVGKQLQQKFWKSHEAI